MPEPMTEQDIMDAEECFNIHSQICQVLFGKVRLLRELHADALRQIKLVQEKADRDIARLQGENERLKRRDDPPDLDWR